MKTLALSQKGQRKLGDKEEYLYTLEQTEGSIEQLLDSLRMFLSTRGENGQHVMKEDCELIRKHLGINAAESQDDVCGFIAVLLRHLRNETLKNKKLRPCS